MIEESKVPESCLQRRKVTPKSNREIPQHNVLLELSNALGFFGVEDVLFVELGADSVMSSRKQEDKTNENATEASWCQETRRKARAGEVGARISPPHLDGAACHALTRQHVHPKALCAPGSGSAPTSAGLLRCW